jgi:hypothetical protein
MQASPELQLSEQKVVEKTQKVSKLLNEQTHLQQTIDGLKR